MKKLFAMVALLAVTHLSVRAADTNSIIGHWETDEILSQLGPSVTAYSFKTNGTFTLSTTFTQGFIPTMRQEGTYYVVTNAASLTNRLVTVAKGRTNTGSIYFEGKTLVIDGGRPTKIFKLERVSAE